MRLSRIAALVFLATASVANFLWFDRQYALRTTTVLARDQHALSAASFALKRDAVFAEAVILIATGLLWLALRPKELRGVDQPEQWVQNNEKFVVLLIALSVIYILFYWAGILRLAGILWLAPIIVLLGMAATSLLGRWLDFLGKRNWIYPLVLVMFSAIVSAVSIIGGVQDMRSFSDFKAHSATATAVVTRLDGGTYYYRYKVGALAYAGRSGVAYQKESVQRGDAISVLYDTRARWYSEAGDVYQQHGMIFFERIVFYGIALPIVFLVSDWFRRRPKKVGSRAAPEA